MNTFPLGYTITMAQTTAYALVPRACRVHSTAALDVSPDNATWSVLANATTGADVGSGFIRCTAATNCAAILVPYV